MNHYNPANDPAVTNGIQEAYGLKIGDTVEYTNPDGGKFGPHTVVGFVQEPDPDFLPNNTVYIDSDSPWYPVKPSSLRKLDGLEQKMKWPVNGGEIIHSAESEYISAIAKEVYRFAAERGQGNELKERYARVLEGKEIDYAEAGFFAMVGGVLIGGLTYHIDKGWVYLHSGYVWEQYRGMGVYSALMQTVEDTAQYNCLSGIWVCTYEFEAPAVYEHMGFTKGSILTNCPKGNTSIDYYKYLDAVASTSKGGPDDARL